MATPEGWRKETILLPPGFAPDMSLRGVEEIRFAPDMFEEGADAFFSYVFALRVEAAPELTPDLLRKELLAYYRRLAEAVLQGQDVEREFVLTLEEKKSENGRVYLGDVNWIEPFVTKQEHTLHLELDVWRAKDGSHQYLFVCASPRRKRQGSGKK